MSPLSGGGTRPHKRGCYARSGAGAIEVLRINALSLYEDKRISTRRAALRRVSRCLPLARVDRCSRMDSDPNASDENSENCCPNWAACKADRRSFGGRLARHDSGIARNRPDFGGRTTYYLVPEVSLTRRRPHPLGRWQMEFHGGGRFSRNFGRRLTKFRESLPFGAPQQLGLLTPPQTRFSRSPNTRRKRLRRSCVIASTGFAHAEPIGIDSVQHC
jgi:hypothetical protein